MKWFTYMNSLFAGMHRSALPTMLLLWLVLSSRANETLFDPNPGHIWNRLHNDLFIRVAPDGSRYGADSVDILYWIRTKNLLEGDSHKQAIKILDEFIEARAANLVEEPWKRALLQSRCWSLFDWAAQKSTFDRETHDACFELQSRLARIIYQLALMPDQIEKLPNNIAANHELSALNEPKSDWVCVKVLSEEITAQAHTKYFEGRSVFTVMFRHPEGRAAASNYLAQLRQFSPMWILRTNADFQRVDSILNPALPQFPEKSQWALVRRMCVIDAVGKIRAAPVVETVQLRTFKKIPKLGANVEQANNSQLMQEFDLRASDASLVEVSPSEKSFTQFLSKGFDPFEERWNNAIPDPSKSQRLTLSACNECHGGRAGIDSVNTFLRLLSREPTMSTTQIGFADSREDDVERSVRWKEHQYSWGLLQGLDYSKPTRWHPTPDSDQSDN